MLIRAERSMASDGGEGATKGPELLVSNSFCVTSSDALVSNSFLLLLVRHLLLIEIH